MQSGRASLGEDLYHAITTEYIPIEEIFLSLSLKTEHTVLETMNRLEGAVFAWNQRISEEKSKKSPGRHSWNFMKDSSSELDKMSMCIERVETLMQLLKSRFPSLPPTFIEVVKIQYNVVSSPLHNNHLCLRRACNLCPKCIMKPYEIPEHVLVLLAEFFAF